MRTIVTLWCVLLLAEASHAAGEAIAARIAGDSVRVRSGPGTRHAVLASLDRGDLVLVVGREGGWCRVRVPGGFTCYVHGSLVGLDGEGGAVVEGTRVLLRVTAGKQHLPLETQLDRDQALTVLGVEGEWVRVIAPSHAHGYVYGELLEELGPVSEYARALEEAGAARRKLLVGVKPDAGKPAVDPKRQEKLRSEVLLAGEKVLAGEGSTEDLTARLRSVSVESEDDLTRGYANALLALLGQREDAERLREELERAGGAREEETAALRERLAGAEARYREALAKAQVLKLLRESPFRAVGVIEQRPEGFVLVEAGRVVFRLRSKRFRLEDYKGRRVGLNGSMVIEDPETGERFLMVEKLEILGTRR